MSEANLRLLAYKSFASERKQGRPKDTWRRTIEREIKAMGLTWGETALERIGWKQKVKDSCSVRS